MNLRPFIAGVFQKIVRLTAKILHLPEQFVCFLYVGVLNTAFAYSLYVFFVWIGFNYIFAPLCSTVLGVLFNFKTIGGIVFQSRNNALLGRFFGVYGLVYLCNVAGLKTLSLVGIGNLYVAGAILVLPLALFGFILNKKWVFHK